MKCSIEAKKREAVINTKITVENLDHLGLVAGIIDELGIVEQINEIIGMSSREKVSAGIIVKAMILSGLGFVTAPLYMFSKFFEGKAVEHLLGSGIKAEYLTDDRLGDVLDALYEEGVSGIFTEICLTGVKKHEVEVKTAHLLQTLRLNFISCRWGI